MNNIKFYFSFLLLIMLMLVFPSQALAATGEVTKTKTFTTTNKKFYYAFDEQITKDGKQYKLKNVDYNQIDEKAESEEKEVVKTKVYHYLYEKKCNPKQELTITRNGKQVQVSLNNIVYKSETIKGRYTYATAHTNYDYVTTKPTAPKTKKINYNDKYTGKTVSVNLPLKSFKSGGEKWINDVSIPMTCKKYDSTVLKGTYRIDRHHQEDNGITFKYLDGTTTSFYGKNDKVVNGNWREELGITGECAKYYSVPFEILVQEKYSNFIAAGRMLNADSAAYGALRVMVNLNQLGEAAGVAAVMSIDSGLAVKELNGVQVKQNLNKGGSCL